LLRWFQRLVARKQNDKRKNKPLANGKDEWKQSLPMTTVAPAPGEVIGDYEILDRIGGNMGFVFKARHRLLDKVVVLKLVPADWIADPTRLTRFQREMRAMGQLEHPNLVTAADARSVGDWHLVAMELIDGVDLQQMVRTQGPLPVAAACEVARQAAQGLQYAHEHGLIHRDIKPSNLMLTRAGTIKVIDMGLALIREDSTAQLTQTGLVLGTMSYCAPEQFRDASHVDIRADIYSLGCTLYNLLTGKSPYWQRKTFAEVMQAHLHEPFPRLTEARPDAPAELEAVLVRMTAKDRDARFSTPKEVVEALEPFARGADLGPLVPATAPQSPPRRGTAGKAPPSPEGRPLAAGGEQRPKARWTRRAALVGLPAVAGVAFFAKHLLSKGDPVVVLMDSPVDRAVYDEDIKGTGKTNAEVLKKVLDGLPLGGTPQLTISDEASKPDWRGENEVIGYRPNLVLFHRSAFFHPVNAQIELGYPAVGEPGYDKWNYLYGVSDDKLVCFMGLVATVLPGTKFLIYSRGTDVKWKDDGFRKKWELNCEQRFRALKGCVNTMLIDPSPTIPSGLKGSFRDPKNADKMRKRVKEILGLPEKAK
jgi:tRNA A-37 threonylcarbamoyl transferase component Bud32